MSHRVTLIPGDGIGPEVSEATRRVLDATGVEIEWDVRRAGAACLEREGTTLPEATLDSIRRSRAALKGPITTPAGTGFRSVNVALRQELDLFAAVRRSNTLPGVATRHPAVDLVVIRRTPRTCTRASSSSTGATRSRPCARSMLRSPARPSHETPASR